MNYWRNLAFPRALALAVLLTALGVELFRFGVIERQSLALWPTFDLLGLDIFHGRLPAPMLLFFLSVQVVIWTAIFYIAIVATRRLRRGIAARRSLGSA